MELQCEVEFELDSFELESDWSDPELLDLCELCGDGTSPVYAVPSQPRLNRIWGL